MASKIYTDKYSSGSLSIGGNRAAISVVLCEKIISLMYNAKESLDKGDKKGWFANLGKIPDEVGLLISTIESAELGEWGDQMCKFYLGVSCSACSLIMGNAAPSVTNELLQKMLEARDLWKGLDVRYIKEIHTSSTQTGGLM